MPRKPAADPEAFLPLSPPMYQLMVALAGQELHGWAIMKEVAGRTGGKIQLSPGTLYGLIKRLLAQRLIEESDRRPPYYWDDQRRRYYRLTDLGRRVAQAEAQRMQQAVEAARSKKLLVPAPRPG
ncbi:MAG TPA: PadR family transcriptional regulator [Acidobacteriota bacterium]